MKLQRTHAGMLVAANQQRIARRSRTMITLAKVTVRSRVCGASLQTARRWLRWGVFGLKAAASGRPRLFRQGPLASDVIERSHGFNLRARGAPLFSTNNARDRASIHNCKFRIGDSPACPAEPENHVSLTPALGEQVMDQDSTSGNCLGYFRQVFECVHNYLPAPQAPLSRQP